MSLSPLIFITFLALLNGGATVKKSCPSSFASLSIGVLAMILRKLVKIIEDIVLVGIVNCVDPPPSILLVVSDSDFIRAMIVVVIVFDETVRSFSILFGKLVSVSSPLCLTRA